MANSYIKTTKDFFCGTAIIGALLGTLILIGLSYVQKIIAGGNPYPTLSR